ncbi:MAG: nickel pincer cofactor biosynthesis protein LarC [Candidatus Korobacteraceae bacterium]|jgi:pyridinium-3,5-bisthiocarboxylic acid mononucleotide nickel chelatase
MRIAYLDCFSGISGDMFLAALLDAGAPFELFEKTVAELKVGAKLERSRVNRGGISAAKLDVIVNGEKDMPREEFWAQSVASGQWSVAGGQRGEHDLHHRDKQKRGHAHSQGVGHAQPQPAVHEHRRSALDHENGTHNRGRHLSEILKIISAATISERAKRTASEIFLALGTAEAKVHNSGTDAIHFHEVGAADAIVDIVCAAAGAEALAVDQFICSPLNVGGGTVACSHGVMPVPAPATLELLKDVPIYSGDIEKELVTPTGAAIVKVLATGFGPRPLMTTEKIGYGAGARDFAGHANVLRISIGETQFFEAPVAGDSGAAETIAILEANLDDLNPQLIGYIVDLALAEGALDVFTTPVQMKKNRPGTLLTVLARPENEEHLRALLFRESSTLGVRTRHEKRDVLPRRHEAVATPWGEVRMKVASLNGTISQYAPEYEDCRRIAAEHHVPLKHVIQEAIRLYLDRRNG